MTGGTLFWTIASNGNEKHGYLTDTLESSCSVSTGCNPLDVGGFMRPNSLQPLLRVEEQD